MSWKQVATAAVVAAVVLILPPEVLADNYHYSRSATDDASATLVVVQRGDFPPSFGALLTGGRVKPDETPQTSKDACDGHLPRLSDLVVTGDAETKYSGPARIDTQVTLFESASMASLDWSRGVPTMTLHCATQAFARGTVPMRITQFRRLPALPCACQNLMFAFEVSFHSSGQPVKTMFVVTSGLRSGRAEASIFVALPMADTQSEKDAFMVMADAFVAVRSRLAKVSGAGLAA